MSKIINPDVEAKFASYPDSIRKQILFLRQLILEVASEMTDVGEIEETLKWGVPSYISKNGSTIRIDWKTSSSEHYAMYFHCGTKLVDTFRELYDNRFCYEGNRAIVFGVNDEIPVAELKQCISLSLDYHRVKHLPMLGV
jgi:hypothetical protein